MRVLLIVIGFLTLSSCRHIPSADCRRDCEGEFDNCRARNGMWWDCKERQENCERACPTPEEADAKRETMLAQRAARKASTPPPPAESDGGTFVTRCTVPMIIQMHNSGMSDSEIDAACKAP